METQAYSYPYAEVEQRAFMTKVYGWMSAALAFTALIAMSIASYDDLINMMVSNRLLFFGLIIAQLGLVVFLSVRIAKMSPTTATLVFFLYSGLTGVTFSILFMIYTAESIASTFLITAATLGAMSAYGYLTKRDLSSWGSFLFMGLIGIIIASVVNWFIQSTALYWAVTYAGVLIFVGLTAYDTQKIKRMGASVESGSDDSRRFAIMGALSLYLDFINLFLMLLRILGNRR